MAKEQGLWRSSVLLCWLLLCLFPLPLAQPKDQYLNASLTSSSARHLLSPSTSHTMELDPKNSSNSTANAKFKQSKHEVPSGPNPVSNR
ncbi:CLAVATA3/ESR (CLE)-related protein 41 [Canna indica]|uniref:CLAVATA3/ESR (CLE)-related protein 41 n=1 Tax=Canna indica TaxID=4628 RepID=A0AAQ3QLX7_9LILI|nr:CLAVATA3/ESR (CLE)-related protein 41 [Canna indica]